MESVCCLEKISFTAVIPKAQQSKTNGHNCKLKIFGCARSLRGVFVIAKYHEVLRRLGLDSMEGVKNFTGELIKNHKGRRDIQRIVPQRATSVPLASSPGNLIFFL